MLDALAAQKRLGMRRGIEKESLRAQPSGWLALGHVGPVGDLRLWLVGPVGELPHLGLGLVLLGFGHGSKNFYRNQEISFTLLVHYNIAVTDVVIVILLKIRLQF